MDIKSVRFATRNSTSNKLPEDIKFHYIVRQSLVKTVKDDASCAKTTWQQTKIIIDNKLHKQQKQKFVAKVCIFNLEKLEENADFHGSRTNGFYLLVLKIKSIRNK